MSAEGFDASVVIPTFGRPDGLALLLSQLNEQSVSPDRYEVIVVDDGSPIDVRTVLPLSDYRFACTVLRQQNAGSAAARQRGTEQATGALLVFLDDDVSIGPGFLEAHLNAHIGRERLVVLGRRCSGANVQSLPLLERYRVTMGERLADEVASAELELSGEYLYTGNVSMPRALFEEVGGFDPQLREICDVELGIRLQKHGAGFALCDAAFNVHEGDPMSTEQWLARGVTDGRYWARVGHKHRDAPSAAPWHWLAVANPIARPLLAASALSPKAAGVTARVGLACAKAAAGTGMEQLAMSGASFVWAVQMFRGVGEEEGTAAAALREYREYRRMLRQSRQRPETAPAPIREFTEAVKADRRALAESHRRWDPRWQQGEDRISATLVNAGFQILFGYRVMRCLRDLGFPMGARVTARAVRHAFGADIHWDAELAPGLVVVHGFGLAISHAARVETGCILSQNVTLGLSRDPLTGMVGAPSLGKHVVVGAGAALIGPITIGENSKIMPNCSVLVSVPPRSVVEAPQPTIRPR
jgi:serine acetyltransferase/GT2 family glycosyltransferase